MERPRPTLEEKIEKAKIVPDLQGRDLGDYVPIPAWKKRIIEDVEINAKIHREPKNTPPIVRRGMV